MSEEMVMVITTSQTATEGRKALMENMENNIRRAFHYEMDQEKEYMESKKIDVPKRYKVRRL